jgi:hypothetical protein
MAAHNPGAVVHPLARNVLSGGWALALYSVNYTAGKPAACYEKEILRGQRANPKVSEISAQEKAHSSW